MKILIIAGHGAGDPGATGVYNGKEYREAEETRKIASMLSAELRRYGVDAQVRNPNANAYKDHLAGRLVFPKANYLLEIHFNALARSNADGKTKGVECYITSHEKGDTVEQGLCRAVASFGLANRGVKRKNFSVISAAKKAGISAALLEVCFIDDPDDMAIYTKNQEAIVRKLAQAICEGFGIDYTEVTAMKKSEPSEWAKDACEWAVKKGIFKGDENGNMKWQETVTREQLAVILHRLNGGA